MYRLRSLIKFILIKPFDWLPTSYVQAFIRALVARRTALLPAAESLRFLFGLDTALYSLQGQQSIRYNGGIHPKHRHTRYHDFFTRHIQEGERVLDIGCGIGAVAYDVAEKAGAAVLGIDLNAANIALACQRHQHPRVTYQVGDVLKDLPSETFDVVILSNVLEHLPGRAEFLRRVQAAAQPARLLIRVPLFERDWRVPLKRELGIEWRLDPTHETEYTLESFAEEIAAAGLRISYQEVRWGEIWAEVTPAGER